jgi:zinc transporter 1/2/3
MAGENDEHAGGVWSSWELELAFRILFAAILAIVAIVAVSLPARLDERNSHLMPIASAFGGGVILSAALVHMLPEASECEALGTFPWPSAMLAAGYLFLLSVEVIVDRLAMAAAMQSAQPSSSPLGCCLPALAQGQQPYLLREHDEELAPSGGDGAGGPHALEKGEGSSGDSLPDDESTGMRRHLLAAQGLDGTATAALAASSGCQGREGGTGGLERREGQGRPPRQQPQQQPCHQPCSQPQTRHYHHHHHHHQHQPPLSAAVAGTCASRNSLGTCSCAQGDGANGLAGRRRRTRPLAALAATCGLSVHALLEGLAVGLRSSPSDFAVICVTIAVHKGFAALALGAVLADGPSEQMRRVASVAFCSATPLGIIVGSALLTLTTCALIAPLSAFSAGSLMWVALHEVISPATNRSDVAAVLVAMWIGFGAMSALAVWV